MNKYGKAVCRKSYSVLQDEFFEHMREAGFRDFERGDLGSTAEHLTSLEYQIEQDKGRLTEVKQEVIEAKQEAKEVRKEVSEAKSELSKVSQKVETRRKISATYSEIENIGSRGITGKYSVSKEELDSLKSLAKEGVHSRSEIHDLKQSVSYYQRQAMDLSSRLSNVKERLQEVTEKYEQLVEVTKPYLLALQRFPEKVKEFFERLFPQRERAEEKEQPKPTRKPKTRDDWSR